MEIMCPTCGETLIQQSKAINCTTCGDKIPPPTEHTVTITLSAYIRCPHGITLEHALSEMDYGLELSEFTGTVIETEMLEFEPVKE